MTVKTGRKSRFLNFSERLEGRAGSSPATGTKSKLLADHEQLRQHPNVS